MDKRKYTAVMLVLAAVIFAIPTPTYASDGSFSSELSETVQWAWNGINSFLSSFGKDKPNKGNMEAGDSDEAQFLDENLGEVEIYTTADGTEVQVRKKVLAAKIKQLERVNSLTTDSLDKAMLEIKNMTPKDLEEMEIDMANAFSNQESFKSKWLDLSDKDVIELNNAYEYTTREAAAEGAQEPTEPITAGKIIEVMTSGFLTEDEAEKAAMAGILAAGALCGAAGAIGAAAKYKAKYESNESLEKSDRYWENEKKIDESIPDFIKKSLPQPPVRGVAAYKVTNPISWNLSYADKPLIDTIKNFISEVNGTWQGAPLAELAGTIVSYSKLHNVDPLLITCQLNQESGFCPDAGSSVGACGIAQFMPETAAGYGINPWNVEQSIDAQCTYMRDLMDEFKIPELALAGYNAGGDKVRKAHGIPAITETQNYVDEISSKLKKLQNAYLAAGGKLEFA